MRNRSHSFVLVRFCSIAYAALAGVSRQRVPAPAQPFDSRVDNRSPAAESRALRATPRATAVLQPAGSRAGSLASIDRGRLVDVAASGRTEPSLACRTVCRAAQVRTVGKDALAARSRRTLNCCDANSIEALRIEHVARRVRFNAEIGITGRYVPRSRHEWQGIHPVAGTSRASPRPFPRPFPRWPCQALVSTDRVRSSPAASCRPSPRK